MTFAPPRRRGWAARAVAWLSPAALISSVLAAPTFAQSPAPLLGAHNLLARMAPKPMGDNNAVRLWVRGDGGGETLRVHLYAVPAAATPKEAALTAPEWRSAPIPITFTGWHELLLPRDHFTMSDPGIGLNTALPAGDQPQGLSAPAPHWAEINAIGLETGVPKTALLNVDDIAWATLDASGAGQSSTPVADFETGDVAAWQSVGTDTQKAALIYGVTTVPARVHGGRVAFQLTVTSPAAARVPLLAQARRDMALTHKPYLVWTLANRFDPIVPSSLPPAVGANSFLALQAAPGQTLGVGVGFYSVHPLTNVTVTVPEDLQGIGHVLSRSFVDVRVVKVMNEPGGGLIRDDDLSSLTPDLLVKDDRVPLTGETPAVRLTGAPVTDIPADSAKEFWITISLPSSARPGLYQGRLLISGAGLATPAPVRMTLNVLPIQLASSPAKQYAIDLRSRLDPPPATLPSLDGHGLVTDFVTKSALDAQLADIHAHGVELATLYDSPDTLWDALPEYEANRIGPPYIYMGDADPRQVEAQRIAHHAPAFEYFIDPNDATRAARITDLGKHGLPVTTYITQLSDYTALQDTLDVPIYSEDSDYSQHMLLTHGVRENDGHDWWYWPAAQESPLQDRLSAGWTLWRANLYGAFIPDYQTAFGADPYDLDSAGAAPGNAALRSQMLTYPVADGVLDTLRWEAIREGITDVLYLTTLSQVMRECKDAHIAKPVVDQAQTYVTTFLDKSPEALTDADLDAARTEVAHFTLVLTSQLNAYDKVHHITP